MSMNREYLSTMISTYPPSKESFENLCSECKVVARSIPKGANVEAHSHAWVQLLYAKEGALFLYLDRSKERMLVSPQQGVLIPAGVKHSVGTLSNVELVSLYMPSEVFDFCSVKAQLVEINSFLKSLLIEMERTPTSNDEGGQKLLVDLVFHRLKSAKRLFTSAPMPHDRRVLQCISSVGIKSICSMDKREFALLSNVSESTLSRIIRVDTNLSYRQWKTQLVVHVAIDEMLNGKSVSGISSELGYDSPSSFIHMFKMMTGRSPARFIELLRG